MGDNLGHILAENNARTASRRGETFAGLYSIGHIDESDPNTCILCVRLTDGVLLSNGTRYEIDFTD